MSRRGSGLVLFGFGSIGVIVIMMMVLGDFVSNIQQEFAQNIRGGLIILACMIFMILIFVIVPLYTFVISHKIPIVRVYDDGLRVRTESGRKSFPITWGDMTLQPNGSKILFSQMHSINHKRGFTTLFLKSLNGLPPHHIYGSWWLLSQDDRTQIIEIIRGNIT